MTIPYADMELHPEEEAPLPDRPARSLWVPLALVGLGLAVAVAWLVLR